MRISRAVFQLPPPHSSPPALSLPARVGYVVILDVAGQPGLAARALPYATAKAAVEGLTRAVAVDHGPAGIRANAVALGSISTARLEEYRAAHPEADAHMAALHPLGRAGTPAEVADAVAFLLSRQAGFINGVILPVDGGRAANGPDPEAI